MSDHEHKQKPEYFEQSVNIRFRYLDRAINRMEKSFEKTVNETKTNMDNSVASIKESVKEIKANNEKIRTEVDEIKADNKATRWWVVGTGMAVIFGIAATFFAFAQIQIAWMQQVITFALKAIK